MIKLCMRARVCVGDRQDCARDQAAHPRRNCPKNEAMSPISISSDINLELTASSTVLQPAAGHTYCNIWVLPLNTLHADFDNNNLPGVCNAGLVIYFDGDLATISVTHSLYFNYILRERLDQST